jgi:hypothetical protein
MKKCPRQRINAPARNDKGEDAAGYPLDRDDFGSESSEILKAICINRLERRF